MTSKDTTICTAVLIATSTATALLAQAPVPVDVDLSEARRIPAKGHDEVKPFSKPDGANQLVLR